jgi:opacity protein-like surface antigen
MRVRRIAWVCLASFGGLILGSAGHAQSALKNDDVAVSGLFEFTQSTSGNGISDSTSKSGGGAASFRHSYHWWLGYEASYQYSRFTEFYSGQAFGIQHNMHEFGGSYYVHGATALGIQPFAIAGVSAVVFSPTLNGGQNVSWQARPGVNFGAGLNYPLVTSHFGVRLEYRGVYYKTPDFGMPQFTTNTYRVTSEPMAGIYIKF